MPSNTVVKTRSIALFAFEVSANGISYRGCYDRRNRSTVKVGQNSIGLAIVKVSSQSCDTDSKMSRAVACHLFEL